MKTPIRKLTLAAVLPLCVACQTVGPATKSEPRKESEAAPITLHVGKLIDGKGGVRNDVTLVVEGSKIRSIKDGSSARATYDFPALTVLPGMIDTHVHIDTHFGKNGRVANPLEQDPNERLLYAAENMYNTLMAGFTTVQGLTSPSIGSPSDASLREAFERDVLPGPRIVSSINFVVNENSGTPEEIRKAVRSYVAQGADVVKLFASKSIRDKGGQTMTDEQIKAACEETKAAGKRTWVHAHSPEAVRASVIGGCSAIAHGSALTNKDLSFMAEHGVYFEPEIWTISMNYIENKDRYAGTSNFSEEAFKITKESIPIKLAMFKKAMNTKGLKIVLGNDAGAGAHGRNAEEIVYRVQVAGQPAMDAITQATSLPAEALGLQDKIGTLAPGMEADLIVVDGDPLQDISVLNREHVVFVMKGGKIFKNTSNARR